MASRPAPSPGQWPVRFGTAEPTQDSDRADGWLLRVDGVAQSHVDLRDPTHLEFEYVRLLADVVDTAAPEGEPIVAVHLGGGGCTLPRYVAATRPGSRQLVVEADDLLADVVRRSLGTAGFRLRVGDARTVLDGLTPGASDVVVSDVFAAWSLPGHLSTREYVAEAGGLLRPGGRFVANLADGPPLAFARRQIANVRAVFDHVVLLAPPSVLRKRRFGNLVVAGSSAPFDVAALTRRAARAAGTARVVAGGVVELVGDAQPVADGAELPAPAPPASLFRAQR